MRMTGRSLRLPTCTKSRGATRRASRAGSSWAGRASCWRSRPGPAKTGARRRPWCSRERGGSRSSRKATAPATDMTARPIGASSRSRLRPKWPSGPACGSSWPAAPSWIPTGRAMSPPPRSASGISASFSPPSRRRRAACRSCSSARASCPGWRKEPPGAGTSKCSPVTATGRSTPPRRSRPRRQI